MKIRCHIPNKLTTQKFLTDSNTLVRKFEGIQNPKKPSGLFYGQLEGEWGRPKSRPKDTLFYLPSACERNFLFNLSRGKFWLPDTQLQSMAADGIETCCIPLWKLSLAERQAIQLMWSTYMNLRNGHHTIIADLSSKKIIRVIQTLSDICRIDLGVRKLSDEHKLKLKFGIGIGVIDNSFSKDMFASQAGLDPELLRKIEINKSRVLSFKYEDYNRAGKFTELGWSLAMEYMQFLVRLQNGATLQSELNRTCFCKECSGVCEIPADYRRFIEECMIEKEWFSNGK